MLYVFRKRAVLLLIALVSLLGTAAVALAATTSGGKAITRVLVVRETTATTSNSTSFVAVPGATTTVFVPSGESALILARFSAESACSGGTGYCSVRILINGAEMDPVAGLDFAFDSTDGGRETAASWESHSMDRSRVVGPGTYTIVVQRATTSSATTLRLDDWSLTVERAQV